jgi:hypothetical protein
MLVGTMEHCPYLGKSRYRSRFPGNGYPRVLHSSWLSPHTPKYICPKWYFILNNSAFDHDDIATYYELHRQCVAQSTPRFHNPPSLPRRSISRIRDPLLLILLANIKHEKHPGRYIIDSDRIACIMRCQGTGHHVAFEVRI